MATQIQLRRDTAANWTAENPVLAEGEEGYELDTGQRKIGDGTTAWASLAYMASGGVGAWGDITGTLADQTDLQAALDAKQPLAAVLTGTTASFTTADETKLDGIASGATANSADATLLDRANHTGTQTAATISDFTTSVDTRVQLIVDAAPAALDTLNELAAALGDDADFAGTMTAALALKAPLASPALTGTPTAPTATPGTNTTQLATTAFVEAAVTGAGGYTDEAAQDAVGSILTDSAEIDLTYNDATPSITASIVAASIDESKLDASVNASLDLADSALQSSAIGSTVQAYSANLDEYAAVNPSAQALALLDDATSADMRSTLGLSPASNVVFGEVRAATAFHVGNEDTSITRTGAGDIAVEGNAVYRAGGTDVPIADGGTGASDAATARTNLGLDTTANQTDSADKRFMTDAQEAIVDGVTAALAAKLANVVEDVTPQLGGPLDVNGNAIVSAANGDIDITPNGTGEINLNGPVNFNTGSGEAGVFGSTEGTAPALVANRVQTYAPTDVAASGVNIVLPGTSATGFLKGTDSSNVNALEFRSIADTKTDLAVPNIIDEDDMVSNSAVHVPTQQSVKAYVDASAGGGTTYSGDGVFLALPSLELMAGTGGVICNVANDVKVRKFNLPYSITIAEFAGRVTNAVSGKFVGFGIYSSDGNTLHIDTGPISAASLGAIVDTFTPVTLSVGWYWFAWTADDTTIQMASSAIDANVAAHVWNGNSIVHMGAAANASTAGQLPATLGTITGGANTAPVVRFNG